MAAKAGGTNGVPDDAEKDEDADVDGDDDADSYEDAAGAAYGAGELTGLPCSSNRVPLLA